MDEKIFWLGHKGIEIALDDGAGELADSAEANLHQSITSCADCHHHGHLLDLPAGDVVELPENDPPDRKEDEIVASYQECLEKKSPPGAHGGANIGKKEVNEEIPKAQSFFHLSSLNIQYFHPFFIEIGKG